MIPKKILIVGGSSGLGKKLAELYAERGDKVGVIARRENLLMKLQQQFPGIQICAADISDDSIDQKIIDVINVIDGVDILILTASIGEFNKNLEPAIELNTIDVNVKGYIRVLTTAYHYFLKKGKGQIAVATSIAAARGNKVAPAYNASKAFQSNYLEGLRLNIKHQKADIAVTELMPGYIKTAMGKGDRMFWIASVDKAARQCIGAIDRKRRRAFITKRWRLVYWLLKALPSFIYDPLMNASWKTRYKT
jgi:short-subunit dehydrogenase